jgi:hypothetical protein
MNPITLQLRKNPVQTMNIRIRYKECPELSMFKMLLVSKLFLMVSRLSARCSPGILHPPQVKVLQIPLRVRGTELAVFLVSR